MEAIKSDPSTRVVTALNDTSWSLFNLNYTSCVTLAIILCSYLYYKINYSYWSRRGIKNPRPLPLLGNIADLMLNNRMKLETKWRNMFGKVYGIYFGSSPVLIIADAEVLRQICIKDFDKFPNHGGDYINRHLKDAILILKDDHWKRVRSIMTPTFTSGKIKRMFKLLDSCSNDLVNCFGEQFGRTAAPGNNSQQVVTGASTTVNLKDIYSLYTMDGITSCCYGLKLERNGSSDLKTAATRDEFVSITMRMFKHEIPRLFISFAVPKFILKAFKFQRASDKRMRPLIVRVRSIIENRLRSGKKFDDYLQILLEAKFNEKLELNETDSKENHHAGLTRESLMKDQDKLVSDVASKTNGQSDGTSMSKLTQEEIEANAAFLMMVGLETTATLLTQCTYTLAHHQDVQQRLYEEIKTLAEYDLDKKTITFDYEALTSSHYLDAVISESLRILAPVIQLDRVCSEDYRLEKYNLTIEKGTKLNLAYYSIMNDPDYWPNPEKFDPERFMPENRDKIVPGSYCPFGLGPRHCLGMRFSLTEAKLGLAKVLMNYKFEPEPGTSWPPTPAFSLGLNPPKNPVVRVTMRN